MALFIQSAENLKLMDGILLNFQVLVEICYIISVPPFNFRTSCDTLRQQYPSAVGEPGKGDFERRMKDGSRSGASLSERVL